MGRRIFGRYLTVDGLPQEELADYNINENYASNTDFKISPQPGEIFDIHTFTLVINDGGSVVQDAYGELAAGAFTGSDGILMQYTQESETIDLTDGVLIQSNFEWNKLTPTSIRESADSDILTVHFDFVAKYGVPITLNPGDEFRLRCKGDFSGLQFHTAYVTGNKRDT